MNEGKGISGKTWLIIAALAVGAYLIYKYMADRSSIESGTQGATGGSLTTGSTTIQKGAIRVNVDQGQPQPPNKKKKTTSTVHNPWHTQPLHKTKTKTTGPTHIGNPKKGGGTIKVPSVVGKPYHTAADTIRHTGLRQYATTPGHKGHFTPHSPGYYVHAESPKAGTKVKKGSMIDLDITKGKGKG